MQFCVIWCVYATRNNADKIPGMEAVVACVS
jgi:hypothetical protein